MRPRTAPPVRSSVFGGLVRAKRAAICRLHNACRLAEAAGSSSEIGDSGKAPHLEGGGSCVNTDVTSWVFLVARMKTVAALLCALGGSVKATWYRRFIFAAVTASPYVSNVGIHLSSLSHSGGR